MAEAVALVEKPVTLATDTTEVAELEHALALDDDDLSKQIRVYEAVKQSQLIALSPLAADPNSGTRGVAYFTQDGHEEEKHFVPLFTSPAFIEKAVDGSPAWRPLVPVKYSGSVLVEHLKGFVLLLNPSSKLEYQITLPD